MNVVAALVPVALALSASAGACAQHVWTGTAGDNEWCTPNNWNPPSVPGGASIIPAEVTQRVSFAGNCTPTFNSLTATGPVLFDGAVRNSGPIIASDVIISSGNFTVGPVTPGAATFSMNGSAQWLSGIIGNQSVRVEAGASFAIDPSAPKTLRNAPLTNSGAVTQRSALTLDGLSPITNSGTWTFAGSFGIGRVTISNPSTFANIGTVNVAFDAPSTAASFGLPVHNNGAINALTGDLMLAELAMNGGTLSVSPGRRIDMTRDSVFDGDCQLSGNGAVALTTGQLRINTGDTLSTLDPAGVGGGFTLNSSPGLDVEVTAQFRNAGAFTWLRGDIVGRSVSMSFRNDGTFTALANSFNIRDFVFDNRGTFAISTPQMFLRDASIATSPPGVLDFRSGTLRRSPLSTPGASARLSFVDAVLRKSTPNGASTDARIEARRSTLDILEGEMTLSASVDPHSLIDSVAQVAPLASLRISGNTLLTTSRFTGGGTATITSGGGILTINDNGSSNDMTGLPGGGLRVENSRITGNGAFENRGKLTFAGGQVGEPLVTTIINNVGDIFVNFAALRLHGNLNNFAQGLIAFDSRLEMAAGALLQNLSGQVLIGDAANISALPGSPAPRLFNYAGGIVTKREPGVAIITAPLKNEGEVFVQQGSLLISGPIDTLIANPAPPFAPGTFSLGEGVYRVAPDATLGFGGRLITQLRGTARMVVQGRCDDYEPTLIRDQAYTEFGTSTQFTESVIVQDNATVQVNEASLLSRIPAGDIFMAFFGLSALKGSGTVDMPVQVNDSARIAPGSSPGTLTIGALQMHGGFLDIEIAGLTPGSQHDRLVVTGSAALAGTLSLALLDGFQPAPGDALTVLSATSVTGAFQTILPPPGLDPALRARVAILPGSVEVRFTCAADFNADATVNADDLGDFITCYFSTPPCPGTDFNADSNIDADDLGDFITAYFGPAC